VNQHLSNVIRLLKELRISPIADVVCGKEATKVTDCRLKDVDLFERARSEVYLIKSRDCFLKVLFEA
jgi:hypothetical protein